MQYHDTIVELDEPRLLEPSDVPGMGPVAGRLTTWLGWRYLTLRRVREQAGGSLPPDPGVPHDVEAHLAEGPADPSAAETAPGQDRLVSRSERLALRIQRLLDKRLNPLGVWIYRRTNGGIAKPWKVEALLLTTRGRRSGRERTVVLRFLPDGDGMVVIATNDGADTAPAWYLNLRADPRARVEVDGRQLPVRAIELSAEEADAWWNRMVESSPSYTRYRRATRRRFPVLRLVPTGEDEAPEGEVLTTGPAR
jgi:deazaflavin-dependent oxidoreductase (nitroreductase family)